ncbi:MAG: GreA/GreB family elongation factor [Chitinophagaceae bacterium]
MTSPERIPVLMTWGDYNLLKALTPDNGLSEAGAFAEELNRAIMVQDYAFPPHAIRLYSQVSVINENTGAVRQLTIVPPGEADETLGKISVFDPFATAIFGFRQGETVDWTFPEGAKKLKIQEVKNELLPFEKLNSSSQYVS